MRCLRDDELERHSRFVERLIKGIIILQIAVIGGLGCLGIALIIALAKYILTH